MDPFVPLDACPVHNVFLILIVQGRPQYFSRRGARFVRNETLSGIRTKSKEKGSKLETKGTKLETKGTKLKQKGTKLQKKRNKTQEKKGTKLKKKAQNPHSSRLRGKGQSAKFVQFVHY